MITCSCGGGGGPYHEIGKNNCFREIAPDNLIPKNFRIQDGIKVCTVNGYTITEYTLLSQRL